MILGVMAQARSGKDTFADYLVKKYGFVKIALADPIKRIAMDVYQMSEEQLWGDDKEKPDLRYPMPGKGFLTPRVACQIIGTEVVRNLYPDTWVDMFKRTATAVMAGGFFYSRTEGLQPDKRLTRFLRRSPQGIICSDIRFKNEVKGFHEVGGKVVRLIRAGKDGSVGVKGHASEEEQKTIPDQDLDGVLNVPEGIPQFHGAIEQLMAKLPMKRRLRLVA
jgi:RNase P/RNase MRP subunit p29